MSKTYVTAFILCYKQISIARTHNKLSGFPYLLNDLGHEDVQELVKIRDIAEV